MKIMVYTLCPFQMAVRACLNEVIEYVHVCIINGKSLERAGSDTREVVLCSGLVEDGGAHRINRRRSPLTHRAAACESRNI